MKIVEISLDAPANKLKKLQGIITPEVAASNYELISKLLAMKLTSTEMDEIGHMVSDEALDEKGVDFYLSLMMKQLGLLGLEELRLAQRRDGSKVILGTVFSKDLEYNGPPMPDKPNQNEFYFSERKFFDIAFHKGRWQVTKMGIYNSSTKRFDGPNEPKKVVDFVTKFVTSARKERAEAQALIDKAKNVAQ